MNDQITLLASMPSAERLLPIINPKPPNGSIERYIMDGAYRGNKPMGGLWTSMHTPTDEFCCDWERGLKTNVAMAKLSALACTDAHKAYRLVPIPTASVLCIDSIAQAEEFSARYRRQRIQELSAIRQQCRL